MVRVCLGSVRGRRSLNAGELPPTERMKACLMADAFISFTGASCQALVWLSEQQSRLE